MDKVQPGADVFFLLMGAILVFAMHGGFAFLEVGTVRKKNQVAARKGLGLDRTEPFVPSVIEFEGWS